MEQDIVPNGHFTRLEGLGSLLAFICWAPPFGNVKNGPPFLNMLLDQPGNWGDVAIPRPDGFVAVTIRTCLAKELMCLCLIPAWFSHDHWIGMGATIRNQLNDQEKHHERANQAQKDRTQAPFLAAIAYWHW